MPKELHPWPPLLAFVLNLDSTEVVSLIDSTGLAVDWALSGNDDFSNKSGWKRLADLPVVVMDGDGKFRQFLTDCEREHGVNFRIGAECTSYPQAVDLAEVTGCAVFVPEYWWRRRKDWAERTHKLPGLEEHRRTFQLGWNRKVIERRPEVAALVKALARGRR